jgi:hypothetical protein
MPIKGKKDLRVYLMNKKTGNTLSGVQKIVIQLCV